METFLDNRRSKTMQFLKMSVVELNMRVQQELVANPVLIKELKSSPTNLIVGQEYHSTSITQPDGKDTDFTIVAKSSRPEIELNSWSSLSIGQPFKTWLSNAVKQNQTDPIAAAKIRFVQGKVNEARRFIKALETRRTLLLKTMNAILDYQYDFFMDGDPAKLKPMVLDDIATRTNLSISAISRAVSGKHVQTIFGEYALKYFFSVGIGQEGRSRRDRSQRVSTYKVKTALNELIDNESKQAPLTDTQLQEILFNRGFSIARRTVAKYREEYNIPGMWLRKQ